MALNINKIIYNNFEIQELGADLSAFNKVLVIGDSDIISGKERILSFNSPSEVLNKFGSNSEEYKFSQIYYANNSAIKKIYIGRWLRTPTSGYLKCGGLSISEQSISNFTSITNGSFKVTIDGVLKTVTSLNFSTATNLNGVASIITTALSGGTVLWDGDRFIFKSSTTGSASTITELTAHTSGTDLSALLKATQALKVDISNGFNAETPLQAVTELESIEEDWYCVTFACSTMPTNSQYLEVANFIEESSDPDNLIQSGVQRCLGISAQDDNMLDELDSTKLSSVLIGKDNTFIQYSNLQKNSCAGLIAVLCSIDFNKEAGAINFFGTEQFGVIPLNIKSMANQNALEIANCNYYTTVSSVTGVSMTYKGVTCSGLPLDVMVNLAWFKLKYKIEMLKLITQQTQSRKISQDSAGMAMIESVARNQVLEKAFEFGMLAIGLAWNGGDIGGLKDGDILDKGYYYESGNILSQSQADREERKSPTNFIALKLSGGINKILTGGIIKQ